MPQTPFELSTIRISSTITLISTVYFSITIIINAVITDLDIGIIFSATG